MSERAQSSKLGEYRRKRDFGATSEPAGSARKRADAPRPRFVVHEHHARRLHWDLRLEHDGALASWAIPNGIPDDPAHNRKAIHVEDHPLDYIDFTGTIPAGSYGAGEVSVWDTGTYECEKWRADEVIVVFAGERLRGRYVLFQAGKEQKDWLIHRMDPPVDPTAQEMPAYVQPMLARLSTLPDDEDTDWAYEVKWDGVRAIARSRPGRLQLISRNGNDVSAAYPELRGLNLKLGSRAAMLDGEIIAFDADGRPSFEALQPRMHQRSPATVRRLARTTPVTYVLFDLLWLDGHSLMELPYAERRARLDELDLNGEHWRAPSYRAGPGEGRALLAATGEQNLEGVVAKRLDSLYVPGGRTGTWLKIKHHNRQEVVIGGWHEGQRARAGRIGALDVGVYDEHSGDLQHGGQLKRDGGLRYAGQVGTGWDERELARLESLLKDIPRAKSPFTGRQPPKDAHYVQPRLVCEVEFSEWTQAGQLRQASYKGLREDKPAEEVVRETAQPPARSPRGSPAGSLTGAIPFEAARRVRGGVEIDIEGRTLRLTNLDKVMYPRTGFTKGDVIGYYAGVAPALLGHLRDRPLTLKRYPDGVESDYFYEKHCPAHRPDWVQTATVYSEHGDREIDYCTCQDLPTLIWLANLASIELHPSLSLARALERPTAMAFDLDPGAPAGIIECCEVALYIRDMLAELDVTALAKTSGVKGMQVYVPLNDARGRGHGRATRGRARTRAHTRARAGAGTTYEQTKPFARAVAELLAQRHPQLVTATMTKSRRRGRVLIDWSQNDEHKTTVSVYSLRATPTPSVSAPVSWEEVRACRDSGDAALLELGPAEVLGRLSERGDQFAQVLTLRQELPKLG